MTKVLTHGAGQRAKRIPIGRVAHIGMCDLSTHRASGALSKCNHYSVSNLTRFLAVLILCLAPSLVSAQATRTQEIALRPGYGIGGANVAVCAQTEGLTAAQVISNTAILTTVGTANIDGFTLGQQIAVTGFTGGDAYFNQASVIITGVTGSTITYTLVHGDATASSVTGAGIFQTGSSSVSCAPLAPIYTSSTGSIAAPNPFTTDSIGNWGFWALPGQYVYQVYGNNVRTQTYPISVSCVPPSTVCGGALFGTLTAGQVAFGDTTPNTIVGSSAFTYNVSTTTLGANHFVGQTMVLGTGVSSGNLFVIDDTSNSTALNNFPIEIRGKSSTLYYEHYTNASGGDVTIQMAGASGSTSYQVDSDNGAEFSIISNAGFTHTTTNSGSVFEVYNPGNSVSIPHFSFNIDLSQLLVGTLVEAVTHTPSSSSDTCRTGQFAWDASFLYVCKSTNAWIRTALATW